eukprot:scaffold16066_cov81-Skeletonema_dohrnii-CCMP3373.AAC.1
MRRHATKLTTERGHYERVFSFCPWIPGSNCKRECSTLLPAARNSIMQQPKKTLFKALQEAQEDGNGGSDDD